MEENRVEKKTFITKSKWWTTDLLKKINPPKLKRGDASWALKYFGWDKDGGKQ